MIKKPRFWLVLVFALLNLSSLVRIAPVNTNHPETQINRKGNHRATIDNIMRRASEKAEKPFFEVKNRFLFKDRNPGFFMFVPEMAARLGLKSPWPLQVFCLLLFNLGLFFLSKWVSLLFKNDWAGVLAALFITITPWGVYHSVNIHQHSYSFLAFNLMTFLFIRYLFTNERKFFWGTLAAYFFLCQNYWMYYISAFVLLVGLEFVFRRKWITRDTVTLAVIPVIAFIVVVLQVANIRGGLGEGLYALGEQAVARAFDQRLEGSTIMEDVDKVNKESIKEYPRIYAKRVRASFSFKPWFYFLMFGFVWFWWRKEREPFPRYFFSYALLATLSWNLIMIQHTMIHGFSAMYGFMFWTLTFVAFYLLGIETLTEKKLSGWKLRLSQLALVAISASFFFDSFIHHYAKNLVANIGRLF